MPKKPRAGLESAILESALWLLDENGMEAVRMREVARHARTSTPTLYGRFGGRENLLWAVVSEIQKDMHRHVAEAKSVIEMAEIVIAYFSRFPGRLEVMNVYWPQIMGSGRQKPVVELARKKFPSAGLGDDRSFCLAALLMGTAMLIRAAGPRTPLASNIKQGALRAVDLICRPLSAERER